MAEANKWALVFKITTIPDSARSQQRRKTSVPFGVYELVELAAVGLHHAFTAGQDVDLTCNRGTVRVIRLPCTAAIREIPVQSVEGGGEVKK